jgi:hypothetical protein
MPLLVTRKGPLSRAFSSSGRRDLNSGPLVPQTDLAVWRQVSASGVKWPISREILAAQWTFAASLRDPVLRRLGPYWAPPRLAGLVLVPGLSVFVSQTFGERNLRADRTYPVGAVGGRRRLPRLPVVGRVKLAIATSSLRTACGAAASVSSVPTWVNAKTIGINDPDAPAGLTLRVRCGVPVVRDFIIAPDGSFVGE